MHISGAPQAHGQAVRVTTDEGTHAGVLRGYGDAVTGRILPGERAIGVVIETAGGREVIPLETVTTIETSAA